jgi:hypothetical protein
MLTGKRDRSGGGRTFAEAAHIIPQATNRNIREEDNKVGICDVRSSVDQRGKLVQQFYSAGVWAVLSMFTDVNLAELLAGDLIHRLENIMIMHQTCHRAFGELLLWLKPVEVRTSDLFPFWHFSYVRPQGLQDTYRVYESEEGWKAEIGIPDIVSFSTKTAFPLPSPALLALHALCCEVAWMSGAAEYITDIERRMDETLVLANDGSTADVLMGVLAFVETS